MLIKPNRAPAELHHPKMNRKLFGKKKWASAHLSCSALYQRVVSYES
jgi:hypothetical protein